MKVIIQYISGVLLIASCGSVDMNVWGKIIVLSGAVMCIPLTRNYAEKVLKIKFSRIVKYLWVIIIWFYVGTLSDKEKTQDNNVIKPLSQAMIINSVKDSANYTPIVNSDTVRERFSSLKADDNGVRTFAAGSNTIHKEKKEEPKRIVQNKKKKITKKSYAGSSRYYIRGPRGGCYYINSSGNKTYVDRSLCN